MLMLSIVLAVTALGVANLAGQEMPSMEQQIAAATLPLPEAFRAGAAVQRISANLEITELRKGSNSMICSIIQPGSETFAAHCFEREYDAFAFRHYQVQHELTKNGKALDQAEFRAAIKKEIESGRLKAPTRSTVGFQMRGPAKAFDWSTNTPSGEIKHWEMIMISNATGASLSLPNSKPANGGPWVMGEGTPGAHIMIEH